MIESDKVRRSTLRNSSSHAEISRAVLSSSQSDTSGSSLWCVVHWITYRVEVHWTERDNVRFALLASTYSWWCLAKGWYHWILSRGNLFIGRNIPIRFVNITLHWLAKIEPLKMSPSTSNVSPSFDFGFSFSSDERDAILLDLNSLYFPSADEIQQILLFVCSFYGL